jgi:hypothetical protein
MSLSSVAAAKAWLPIGHADLKDASVGKQGAAVRDRQGVLPHRGASLDEYLLALFESQEQRAGTNGILRLARQQRFIAGNQVDRQQAVSKLPGEIVEGEFQGRSFGRAD